MSIGNEDRSGAPVGDSPPIPEWEEEALGCLEELDDLRMRIQLEEKSLEQIFAAAIAYRIFPGAIVRTDDRKDWFLRLAHVVRGNGFGAKHFKIISGPRIEIASVVFLSHWTASAIPMNSQGKELHGEVRIRADIFKWSSPDLGEGQVASENDMILEGLQKHRDAAEALIAERAK